MTNSGSTLELAHVTIAREGRTLVKDVSLRAEPGRTLALIGPSGCGKTTVLRAAALLDRIDEGTITIDGERVDTLRERMLRKRELRGRSIAYVFQGNALFEDSTVAWNLRWPLEVHGLTRGGKQREAKERVHDAAGRAGLSEDLLERAVASLSGGERKRVAIARALVLEPRILLYDEPTSGLDPPRARAIDELILQLRAEGLTAIVATHDMESARHVADEVLLLQKRGPDREGRIAARGTFDELRTDEHACAFLAGETHPRAIYCGDHS
ncbi:MAG: ATP-binding cassette domain-containing protein [Planctomycetes bacterium]|nr:ATP-binding cassette domain-containing protein [Planctomycetota bacterium]